MLLNPTGADRMQSNREEKREPEIKESRPTTKINDGCVVCCRTHEIDEGPPVPHGDRFQSGRPGKLKKWEKHEPQSFSMPFVADQTRFPMICEVSIVFVIALMRMMLQMINAKTHRARRKVRQISDDGHHLVQAFVPQNQIMSRIVNNHVVGMIRERADAISDDQTDPPITEPDCAHPIRDRCLHSHDG